MKESRPNNKTLPALWWSLQAAPREQRRGFFYGEMIWKDQQ
jgi:hypothetical protein